MKEFAACVGKRLPPNATVKGPAISCRIFEFLPKAVDQTATGRVLSGVRRSKSPGCINSAKWPDHGRRVLDLASRN
jgi:hypothetical protein